jgi:molybdopterin synthase sulfur carrier subunit
MAQVKVRIPTPLQKLTGGKGEVMGEGETIKDVFASLESQYPGFKERLYDDGGVLRRFINIYVNEEDIRFLSGEGTQLKDGDDISVIPAIAGGK